VLLLVLPLPLLQLLLAASCQNYTTVATAAPVTSSRLLLLLPEQPALDAHVRAKQRTVGQHVRHGRACRGGHLGQRTLRRCLPHHRTRRVCKPSRCANGKHPWQRRAQSGSCRPAGSFSFSLCQGDRRERIIDKEKHRSLHGTTHEPMCSKFCCCQEIARA
jgi:hypothetical protein